MEQKILLYQLKAIRESVYSGSENCHWQVGLALNEIREMLISSCSEQYAKVVEKLCNPIEIRRDAPYTVVRGDALRLCDQLIPFCLDDRPSAERSEESSHSGNGERAAPSPGAVFIVHGHDVANTLRLRTLLKERFGLHPMILSEEPGRGRTVIEKFEEEASRAAFAFALVTPDDLVSVAGVQRTQARPNVIFELGWFCGRLGREKICILFREGTSIHSDLDGVSSRLRKNL